MTTIVSGYFKLFDYLMYDLGPELSVQWRHVINFWKFGAFAFVLSAMYQFGNFTRETWTYLTIHGSQGWMWLLKDTLFPDASFDTKLRQGSFVLLNLGLMLYLQGAWTLISGWDLQKCRNYLDIATDGMKSLRFAVATGQFIVGLSIMLLSDQYKYIFIKQVKKTGETLLIKDGLFTLTRNPNQLGEIILYFTFALVADSFIYQIFLVTFWVFVFGRFLSNKEKRLSMKPGAEKQFAMTNMLLPRIFRNSDLDNSFWAFCFVLQLQVLSQAGGINLCLA